jgi:CheY-like chemotaxis protein/HPt (histidine-containing phosphotransfer) domain-containing protein
MKILVVDDDPVCRTLIVKGLEKAGYDTVEAQDARQALRLLQSDGAISLLTIDLMMPETDGFGLLDQIRKAPYLAGLPVLICSALGSPDIVRRAARLNIAGYLLKPIDPRRLRQEVERIQEARIRPLADVRETLSRLEVDEASYLGMLTALLEKLSQDLPEISRLCDRRDSQELSIRLARLSGAAQSLGAEALSDIIGRMSAANAANESSFISSLIPELEKAAAELREAVPRPSQQPEPTNA